MIAIWYKVYALGRERERETREDGRRKNWMNKRKGMERMEDEKERAKTLGTHTHKHE